MSSDVSGGFSKWQEAATPCSQASLPDVTAWALRDTPRPRSRAMPDLSHQGAGLPKE